MSEVEQLQEIIITILKSSNEKRKEGEELLKQSKKNDINTYVRTFLTLINESDKPEIRMFCAVNLRNILSYFSNVEDNFKWVDLNGQTQKFIKEASFELLRKEPTKNVRRALCDLIGGIGCTINAMSDEDQEECAQEGRAWDELMGELFKFLKHEDLKFVWCSLKIMAILFQNTGEYYSEHTEELHKIFEEYMAHDDIEIRAVAIEALAGLLELIDYEDCKPYADLIRPFLKNAVEIVCADEELGVDLLSNLQDLIDIEPRIFKPEFDNLLEACKIVVNKDLDHHSLKESIIEGVVIFLERTPQIAAQESILNQLYEIVFTYMISQEEDPNEEWATPPEGFGENNDKGEIEDDEPIKFGMHMIDRLIEASEEKKAIPALSKLLVKMVQQEDWKYKHAALMALSQVGEYVQDVEEMTEIVPFILGFLQNDHMKVRYASLHAIGQISEDMRPDFQKRFGKDVLTALLPIFQDPVPRVVSHVLAAFTNFLEGISQKDVEPYIKDILGPCLQMVQQGISIVRENAMSTISALAEAAKDKFNEYWQQTADVVYDILRNYTSKQYKQLRGQCIECLTMIGVSVGKEEFKKASNDIIMTMIEIQNNYVEESDPQKSYLLSGWQRICVILRQEFVPYLDDILPKVFDLLGGVVTRELSKNHDDNDADIVETAFADKFTKKQHNINTSETEELKLGLSMLSTFITELRGGFIKYAQKATKIVLQLLDYTINEGVRMTCAKCLPCLLRVVKESNLSDEDKIAALRKMSWDFTDNLFLTILGEFDAKTMTLLTYALKEIVLESQGCFDEKQMKEITENFIRGLQDSDERKQNNIKNNDDPTYDDHDKKMFKEENEMEDEFCCALGEFAGALFKTHKELSAPLAVLLYKEVLPKVLGEKASYRMNKFGLIVIDGMIEHLGFGMLKDEWEHLAEALFRFADHKQNDVRSIACRGIGSLAENSGDEFKQVVDDALEALFKAYNVEKKSNEHERQYALSRESVTIALGKIIKKQSGNVQNIGGIIQEWVKCLPIRFDADESRVQHAMLVQIITEINANLVFGENGELIGQVLTVFAQIYRTKYSNDDIAKKMKQIITTLADDTGTKPLVQTAIGNLPEHLQKKLQYLMEGNKE